MIGLIDMAMCLAERRVSVGENWSLAGFWTCHKIEPVYRDFVNPALHPVAAEYYRIIDRLSRGEKP